MSKKEDVAGQLLGWSVGTGIDKKELEGLVDLPGIYSFKVISDAGQQEQVQAELVDGVEKKLGRKLQQSELSLRNSAHGKYVSFTFAIYVTTLEEIFDIYAVLRVHKATRFLL